MKTSSRSGFFSRMSRKKREGLILLAMAAPFLLLSFAFTYLPLYGWVYAFYDFRPPRPLAASEFVGWHWFQSLWGNPVRVRQITEVLRNTFAMSGLGIATAWLPVAFAIFLSEIRFSKMKKSIQVLTTLPNYISWVLVYSMAFTLFAVDGLFNNLFMSWGFIDQRIAFLSSENHVWLTMTAWNIWKGLGWGAIIYLAALSGIDQEQYEAAKVDGAGRFQLIRHITIPGLLPTFTVLLLLQIANFLNTGFEQYFLFSNAFNMHRIQVLDLYVYNISFVGGNYSLGTAVSMLRSIISVIMLFSVNWIAKLLRGESLI